MDACRSNLDDGAEHLLVVEAGLLLKAVGDETRVVALDIALRGVLLTDDPVAVNEVHVGITRNNGPKSKCEEGQQTPRTWQCTILDAAGLPSH